MRELNGNEEEPYDNYLRDASMYARGNLYHIFQNPKICNTTHYIRVCKAKHSPTYVHCLYMEIKYTLAYIQHVIPLSEPTLHTY